VKESRCEELASIPVDNDVVIDHDPCRPKVLSSGSAASLAVAPDQHIAMFRSFSRTFASVSREPITLQYRSCAKPES
jgi:hypothetical protein